MPRAFAAAALVLLAFAHGAAGSPPCKRNPCNASAADRSDVPWACWNVADWVIEGNAVSVKNGATEICVDSPGRSPRCSKVWDKGELTLASPVWKKGARGEDKRTITLSGGSHCWEALARVPEEWRNRRVRVYGKSKGTGFWTQPGIFAAELIDDGHQKR